MFKEALCYYLGLSHLVGKLIPCQVFDLGFVRVRSRFDPPFYKSPCLALYIYISKDDTGSISYVVLGEFPRVSSPKLLFLTAPGAVLRLVVGADNAPIASDIL